MILLEGMPWGLAALLALAVAGVASLPFWISAYLHELEQHHRDPPLR